MEQNRILLHRISYCGEISWPLLKAGYLSIGWADSVDEQNQEYLKNGNFKDFENRVYARAKSRNRFSLFRFVSLRKGDWVVVPQPYFFSVYEVLESPITVWQLPLSEQIKCGNNILDKDSRGFLLWKDKNGQETGNKKVFDIGFLVKVREIEKNISRGSFIDAPLNSRLKIRSTNVWINDLRSNVEDAIKRKKENAPIRVYENIIKNTAEIVLKTLMTSITDVKLQNLIKWYFYKIGADNVEIPPRNPAGKQDFEDADIIATFEAIKTIIYVQAKFHKDTSETGDWAVKQIARYSQLHQQNEYTVGKWVISTAKFNQQAIREAEKNDVRLIDGKQFAIMLLKVGISSLEKENF